VALAIIGIVAFITCLFFFIRAVVKKKAKKWWITGLATGMVLFLIGLPDLQGPPAIIPSTPIASTPEGFKQIGVKPPNIFVMLVTPSTDNIDNAELANKLKEGWGNKDEVVVLVFDDEEAPKEWMSIWDKAGIMAGPEWQKQQDSIFPHRIAEYTKNMNLEKVDFFSREVNYDIVQTINFN
jgi:hypothetical protein